MAPKGHTGNKKLVPPDSGTSVQKKELVYIKVLLPDKTRVYLEGISNYKITDVRELLSVNIRTCNITNFSLSHKVMGTSLKDEVDVSALKPCTLSVVDVPYDERSAKAHVTRLLEIVGCKTSFGTSGVNAAGEGDMKNTSPKLGSFCEFLSLCRLTPPPLQFIREVKKKTTGADHLFSLEVKFSTGKPVFIGASKKGFYELEEPQNRCHNLVDLLRQLSTDFANVYDELMKAYVERYKFGDPPFWLHTQHMAKLIC